MVSSCTLCSRVRLTSTLSVYPWSLCLIFDDLCTSNNNRGDKILQSANEDKKLPQQ